MTSLERGREEMIRSRIHVLAGEASRAWIRYAQPQSWVHAHHYTELLQCTHSRSFINTDPPTQIHRHNRLLRQRDTLTHTRHLQFIHRI